MGEDIKPGKTAGIILLVFAVLAIVMSFLATDNKEVLTKKSYIYLTAAHIPHEDVEKKTGYIYLGKHSELDLAYYIDAEYRAVLNYDGAITIEGLSEVSIHSVKEGYFLVQVEDTTEVYAGLSGSRVMADNVAIGFVSEFTKEGYLKCVTLPIEFR